MILLRRAVMSTSYSVGQLALGLLLHPYQTLQSVVQEKVFLWMTGLPAVVLILLIFIWQKVVGQFFYSFFACDFSSSFACGGVHFLARLGLLFFFFWPNLLLLFFFLVFSAV